MSALFGSQPAAPPPPPPPVLEAPDPEAQKRKARLEALHRRRRGRPGTIRTGHRGLASLRNAGAAGGKSLLGE